MLAKSWKFKRPISCDIMVKLCRIPVPTQSSSFCVGLQVVKHNVCVFAWRRLGVSSWWEEKRRIRDERRRNYLLWNFKLPPSHGLGLWPGEQCCHHTKSDFVICYPSSRCHVIQSQVKSDFWVGIVFLEPVQSCWYKVVQGGRSRDAWTTAVADSYTGRRRRIYWPNTTQKEQIETKIKRSKWGWIGQSSSNKTRQALTWNSEGKRNSWKRSVEAEDRPAQTQVEEVHGWPVLPKGQKVLREVTENTSNGKPHICNHKAPKKNKQTWLHFLDCCWDKCQVLTTGCTPVHRHYRWSWYRKCWVKHNAEVNTVFRKQGYFLINLLLFITRGVASCWPGEGMVCWLTGSSSWYFPPQFEEEMVDICLKMLDVNPKHAKDAADDVSARCNPIYVSRVVSAMVGSQSLCDDENCDTNVPFIYRTLKKMDHFLC